MTHTVFVPTLVDAANLNPQIGNVREILAAWDSPDWRFRAFSYGEPDPRVTANPRVEVTRLWRRHLWMLHMFMAYLRGCDLVFYPAVHAVDFAGLRWRRRLGRKALLVTTLEGLVGNPARESLYSGFAGHPVYCQPVAETTLARIEARNEQADHIVAISPFLQRIGSQRYGNKVVMLPLGINSTFFHSLDRPPNPRLRVVSVGAVRAHKRPELMLQLARRFRDCDFVWYGEGDMRSGLASEARLAGLNNLSFPGSLMPAGLGSALRQADLFILPSRSEGVPKVTQEAAACGVAQVIFGFYEAPSVVDGVNGHVVWDDQEFEARIAQLLNDREQLERLGRAGAEMARAWEWTAVAPLWRAWLETIVDKP